MPVSTSLTGLSRTISSRAWVASATEPLRPTSWAFWSWTILFSGSFFRASLKCSRASPALPRLMRDLGVDDVGDRGLLPSRPDLGDNRRGFVEPVLIQFEARELDQRFGAVGPIRDPAKQLAGLVQVLEFFGLDLGTQDHELDAVGLVAEERFEDLIGFLGLLVLDLQGGLQTSKFGASRILRTRLRRSSLASGFFPVSWRIRMASCSAASPPLPWARNGWSRAMA